MMQCAPQDNQENNLTSPEKKEEDTSALSLLHARTPGYGCFQRVTVSISTQNSTNRMSVTPKKRRTY